MRSHHRVVCIVGIVGLVVAGLLTSGSGGLPAARQASHTAPVAVPDPTGVTLPQYDPQMLTDLATQAETARQAAIAQLAADEAQRLADELAATVAASAARIASSPPQEAVTAPPPPDGCRGVNPYAAYIYNHESGCNPASVNGSGCRGLGQACPGSKLPCSDSDFGCQDAWFSGYANSRYGGWEAAYQWWISHSWW